MSSHGAVQVQYTGVYGEGVVDVVQSAGVVGKSWEWLEKKLRSPSGGSGEKEGKSSEGEESVRK